MGMPLWHVQTFRNNNILKIFENELDIAPYMFLDMGEMCFSGVDEFGEFFSERGHV